jgi:hypothetical protein
MALFALFGSAAFLAWPIWIGPLVLTLAVIVAARRDLHWAARAQQLALALAPLAVLAAIYAATRIAYGFDMIHAVGFVVLPSAAALTWPFIIIGASGLAYAMTQRVARSAAILFAAIATQATALIVPGLRGADVPYLSLKMTYLAIYPAAVAGAVLFGNGWRDVTRRPAATPRLAWLIVVGATIGVTVSVARAIAMAPAPTPVIRQAVFLAGEWARTHAAPACVDYLVADGYTGYWLHIAVLGNPRAAGRALDNDTFEPTKALDRWILPGGLPYAIADRFDGLPRDIREHVYVLARFGPAAVVERQGPANCP